MKERPILFSTPMLQAILEGKKTQTRRIMKVQPSLEGMQVGTLMDTTGNSKNKGKFNWIRMANEYTIDVSDNKFFKCPFGKIGDRLWVRETFALWDNCEGLSGIDYRATRTCNDVDRGWKPSIFMPRKYSRITLEITNIRVERLQNISQGDAQEEGCEGQIDNGLITPVEAYEALWESINGKGSWRLNPWVWVIEFKRI